MTAQHTPGPWYERHGQISSGNSTHGCTIANCNATARGIPTGEVEANATLIAAAPDLLAALEQCLPILDAHRRAALGEGDLTARTARAAIAKAGGDK